MVKYIIYAAAGLLILWSVFYVILAVRKQLKGHGSCDGACDSCTSSCKRRK